ncbi:acyl-CoA dehydrogenase family protein [Phenylobacterium sp. LjRoot219]|uniref:acyl-CoA dehydrogenase family protein n=1 Tax=Phenylobacterium sp. LjRoot219 TaxID=3342283 RepID=UPI003ECDBE98
MSASDIEDVESFRLRARAWISEHLGPAGYADLHPFADTDEEELANANRDRALQRRLFDGGFAGICFPREYGGLGLTPAHQRAFNEELAGWEYPSRLAVPTFSPCTAVLLDFGTDEQKRRHIPRILKGEEVWCQFLSEPSGGSDVAGALTSAVRDGDGWILNGSKVWTSTAWWGDWALCLARTNWDVPKHQGLTVFMLPIQQSGIEIRRIERLNGSTESCEEFLTDVRVPDSDRIGAVDDGWTVGSRWMYHERVGHNSPYVTRPVTAFGAARRGSPAVRVAREAGLIADSAARGLIGESRMLQLVTESLLHRLASAGPGSNLGEHAAAVGRLFSGVSSVRRTSIAFELAGDIGAAWDEDEDGAAAECGMNFLMRQTTCIGGGTTEISRNVIAERLLGMPREPAPDRGVPFREVPRGPRQR